MCFRKKRSPDFAKPWLVPNYINIASNDRMIKLRTYTLLLLQCHRNVNIYFWGQQNNWAQVILPIHQTNVYLPTHRINVFNLKMWICKLHCNAMQVWSPQPFAVNSLRNTRDGYGVCHQVVQYIALQWSHRNAISKMCGLFLFYHSQKEKMSTKPS